MNNKDEVDKVDFMDRYDIPFKSNKSTLPT